MDTTLTQIIINSHGTTQGTTPPSHLFGLFDHMSTPLDLNMKIVQHNAVTESPIILRSSKKALSDMVRNKTIPKLIIEEGSLERWQRIMYFPSFVVSLGVGFISNHGR